MNNVVIMWESRITGRRDMLHPVSRSLAERCLPKLNREYPYMHHWIEELPDTPPQPRGADTEDAG